VLIQVGGGTTDIDDDRFDERGAAGRVEIHIMRGSGTPHKIIIDDQGLQFDIQGNLMMVSSGDIGLYSKGKLLLAGELVFVYGKIEQRNIVAFEVLMVRAGIPQTV